MAKYKEIKGFKVQTLASDTAVSIAATGSWSSGGNLNTAKGQVVGFGVTAAAGAAMGTSPSLVTSFEQYDGSSWTETTDINTAGRNGLGTGTLTAGLIYGGWPRAGKTESWNGSAWTEVGDMTRGANASQSQAGGGSQTAAFAAGGEPGTTYFQLAEIWNGSSWTEVAELNTGRQAAQGFGVTTAGYVASGYSPPVGSPYKTANVEVYNGSSWTETTNVNTAVGQGGGAGNATSGIIFAGNTGSTTAVAAAKTEFWDGSSWTELADMSTARYQLGKTVNPSTGSTDALAIGGEVPSYVASTEEWATASSFTKINLGQVYYNSTANAFKVTALSAPAGTWASGGTLNAKRNIATACGTGNSSNMVTGGSSPPTNHSTLNEQYNGTAWTEVGDLNVGKNNASSAGNSPIATTLNYAGDGPGTYSDTNESWNNTSWTEEADLNVSGNAASGFGVSATSAGRAGGQSSATPPGGPHFTGTEIWNGSSWTEVNNLNDSRRYAGGVGTVTAALYIGGDRDTGSPSQTANVESWDGTNWTEIANLNSAKQAGKTAGTQTNTIFFGGTPPLTTNTEVWNGSTWTEIGDMTVARANHTGGGSSSSAIAAGGETPLSPAVTAVAEEWSGSETNATITVS